MQRYKVVELEPEPVPVPPTALGKMLMVEDNQLQETKMFVLKKVECIDEDEANQALNEAIILLKLQHSSICVYREFFVTWDQEISSIFLCLVMEHKGEGDLSCLIEDKRREQEAIEEMVIQRLLGHALDALVYMHKQNILHRNLKPTNILLTEKDSFTITDLSLETLMNDELKLNIRVEEGCKSWMAPEALEFSFTEKSDVWSLGCIVLEMMTCSTLSATEVTQMLCELRKDAVCLQNTLETLQERDGYSEPLCNILRKMLQICPEERATVIELLDVPYMKKCIESIKPISSEEKKCLPPGITNVLYEGGIEISLEFMEFYDAFEDAQVAALHHLTKFIGNQDALSYISDIIPCVSNAMKKHVGCVELLLQGYKVMYEIISQALEQSLNEEALNNERLISVIVEIVRTHFHHKELLSLSCCLLMMLSANDKAAESLGKAGVVLEVLKVLRHFSADRSLCLSCLGVLWGVSVNDRNTIRVSIEGAVQTICNVMQVYFQDGDVLELACCTLWGLCLQGCIDEEQCEAVTLILLESLGRHPGRPVLVNNASLALAGLLRTSEMAALRIIVPVTGISGITVIKGSYQLHCDNPEVVENILLLFLEMVQHGYSGPR
ncbi:serine/threonine kinase-like domain-containing protein STKLD1 isoform X2 [Microcaecilia unicolor]|uniref:non-specific serine/threonine protein kinase n=1 Tax=Microcaecilia unicolor TaxID=1415580 RepID=A0A6P7YKF8_9AMPH|nr:serine/threonine kinase-like domain-containing protein STKLD1 isoform X2 [Microcaecilia unicolor]